LGLASWAAAGSALGADVKKASVTPGSRVRLQGVAGAAVRRAVEGARLRLMEPACSRLLTTFLDQGGEPLQSRLDAMGLSAADYVGVVLFVDGSSQRACCTGEVLGGTQPGSRVVAFCGASFAETERRNARLAEALVIHETFHSLGLGENPPSSQEITMRVLRSCQERAAIVEKGR
jgi:hypothetical protein